MAYFDNAATTFPKPEIVYSEMDRFYRSNGASAGRGSYEKAAAACDSFSLFIEKSFRIRIRLV